MIGTRSRVLSLSIIISIAILWGLQALTASKYQQSFVVNQNKDVMFFSKADDDKIGYESSMQIQSGWKWEQERNYTYIRGRIKNAGDKITRYWAIEARYFGPNGEVLDKDMTNSAQNLYPGQMQTFEIMHKDDPLYKSVDLHVIEVRLQQ